jgi:hypothetical protein
VGREGQPRRYSQPQDDHDDPHSRGKYAEGELEYVLQVERVGHMVRMLAIEALRQRTSENSVNAKFGEITFHDVPE